MRTRSTFGVAVLWLLGSMLAPSSSPAVALMIDNFTQRTTLPAGLTQQTIGSQTAIDAPLPNVRGGSRRITVAVTGLEFPQLDSVNVKIAPTGSLLNYASTAGANGHFDLVYDAGGNGLNADFSAEHGVGVDIAAADMAAVPYTVTLALTDTLGHSASSTQTITTAGARQVLFSLARFPGIDLRKIRAVAFTVDPGKGGDMQINRVRTLEGRPWKRPRQAAQPRPHARWGN